MSAARTALLSSAIVCAAVAATGAITQGFRSFTYEAALRTSVREQPRLVPAAIALQDDAGADVSFAAFRGQWLLVNFIYTHCTTLCSAQNSLYAQASAAPLPQANSPAPRFVSISFDPARDTPAALTRYRDLLDPTQGSDRWTLLRPRTATDLTRLKKLFGVRIIPDGLGGFEHNAATSVVDPKGRLVAIFDWNDLGGALHYTQDPAIP